MEAGADLMIANKRLLYPFCTYARCLLVFESKIEKHSPEFKHYMWLQEKVNNRVGDLGAGYIVSLCIEFDNYFVYEDYIKDPKFANDITNHQGDTLMHVAAISGRERAMKATLEADYDVNAKNKHDFNNTPLHKACQFNQVNIIQLVEKHAKGKASID